ncbi:MAG: hypothetical protein HY901_01275 [Deltaproteobacteria bacterium]|nr:hypothetical protein [Deltaproteobacteria bacterium]
MNKQLLLIIFLVASAAIGLRCGGGHETPTDAAMVSVDAETIPWDADVPPDAAAQAPDTGPRPCDPSQCALGNVCAQNRCMLTCARHTECPGGYDCRSIEGTQVCVENGKLFGKGMFGYSCGAATAKCAEGFRCVGPKLDPTSYCTRSPCVDDSECPGNYYCTDIDDEAASDQPDAGRAIDTGYHSPPTVKVCLKRDFCAPATGLLDCNRSDAVFAQDEQGQGWCLRSCSGIDPNGCGGGNGCYATDGGFQCWPRSKTCAPTKTFCSRCTSSADCPEGGLCFEASGFTKERLCTKPCQATEDCNPATLPDDRVAGACFETTSWGVQCLPETADDEDPIFPLSCWWPLDY